MSAMIISQEKEIEFLKKNAVAQEIRIKDLETLVNKMVMVMVNGATPQDSRIGLMSVRDVFTKSSNDLGEYRAQLLMNVKLSLIQERDADVENERKISKERGPTIPQQPTLSHVRSKLTVFAEKYGLDTKEAQQAILDVKCIKEAEKKKAMLARVALREETAKKEELELENLKLISEPKMEKTEMQRLMVSEVNAPARAAEMRAEQAKLRGTQKNCSKSSCDPSTWSIEKAEIISRIWCE